MSYADRPKSSVLCKFYMNGACRNPSCGFSHTMADLPNLVCKYYLQGCCKYGARCRYDHVRPGWSASSTAAAPQPTSHPAAAFPSPSGAAAARPHPVQNAWEQGGPHQATSRQAGEQGQALQLPSRLDDDEEEEEWYVEGEEGDQEGQGWNFYDQQGEETYWDCEQDEEAMFDGSRHDYETWMQGAVEGIGGLGLGSPGVGDEEAEAEAEGGLEAAGSSSQEQAREDEPELPASLTGPEDPSEIELCPWYTLKGHCARQNRCKFIHGEECQVCHKMAIHPYNPDAAAAHTEECIKRHNKLQARLMSADIECSICYERVLSNPNPSDRRFGLMSCDHPFCLKCIRGWRATSTADVDTAVRTCPVCRTTCFFITPSGVWPTNAEEKDEIVSNYKRRLSTIDCQHFAKGEGTCPFGTSCFYRHAYPDGTLEERDVRRARGGDGTRVMGSIRLSSFLNTPNAQRLLRRDAPRHRR